MSVAAWRERLVAITLLSLPLSTAVHEVSLAILLGVALVFARAKGFLALPWAGPAAALAVTCVLGAWASGDLREGWGQAWLLAPLLALAEPADPVQVQRRVRVGLFAAGVAAAIAIGQAAQGQGGRGLFSHHLSLAYALLPPFAVALSGRRWAIAALLAAGVLAARSDAAPLALLATAAAVWTRRPLLSMGAGAAATLAALAVFANPEELRQRAILWTGGLLLSPGQAGVGGYPSASAPVYDQLSPGFWFPNHAHDSLVQLGATLGPSGVLALALLLVVAVRRGHPGAAAGCVGVVGGGLTQHTVGDLEVARAAWVWLAILGTSGQVDGRIPAWLPSSSAPPSPEPSTRP
jgi:hypothetical protein